MEQIVCAIKYGDFALREDHKDKNPPHINRREASRLTRAEIQHRVGPLESYGPSSMLFDRALHFKSDDERRDFLSFFQGLGKTTRLLNASPLNPKRLTRCRKSADILSSEAAD